MHLIKEAVIKYYLISNYSLKLEAAIKINSPYKTKGMSFLIPGHRDGSSPGLKPEPLSSSLLCSIMPYDSFPTIWDFLFVFH